jgi:drug/metabolite transporter (DMT)-like permease
MNETAKTSTLPGIALFVAAVCLFPFMDATAKHLSAEYHVAQIVWARYTFHLIVVAALLRGSLVKYVRSRSLRLQIVRTVLMIGATFLFFTALRYIPLANAIAINFLAPLLVVTFSAPLLKEKVEPVRWLAVAVGFGAVLLIIRPGVQGFQWASLLVIGSASCYALYQLVTRRLSTVDHPFTTLFYSGIGGFLVFSVWAPFEWRDPTPVAWLLMVMMGLIGGLSHYFLIRAFVYAPASVLAPFNYGTIVVGTGIGYVWFGNFPDQWAIAGTIILIVSGLSLAWREARIGMTARRAATKLVSQTGEGRNPR